MNIQANIGDTLYLKCMNSKKEYSVYRIEVDENVVAGNGLAAFLDETTGVEVQDD